jgi:hypothetical protein
MTRSITIAILACLSIAIPTVVAAQVTSKGPVYVAPTPTLQTQTDARCGARPIAVCTRDRVASLRQLSDDLNRAAALSPDTRPQTASEQQELASYNGWLNAQSAEAGRLAAQGERALVQADLQMSFNMQYLALQSRMREESRKFTTVSNVMKTKHDTAKNSISNMR